MRRSKPLVGGRRSRTDVHFREYPETLRVYSFRVLPKETYTGNSGSGHGPNLGDWQHHSRLAETEAPRHPPVHRRSHPSQRGDLHSQECSVSPIQSRRHCRCGGRTGSMGAAASAFASMPCHPSSMRAAPGDLSEHPVPARDTAVRRAGPKHMRCPGDEAHSAGNVVSWFHRPFPPTPTRVRGRDWWRPGGR